MRNLIILCSLLFAVNSVKADQMPSWYLNVNEFDDSLEVGKAVLKVEVYPANAKIILTNSRTGEGVKANKNWDVTKGTFVYDLDSGVYDIQIFARNYESVNQTLEIKSQHFVVGHANLYEVYIREEPIMHEVYKPVVYLYPSESTTISLEVNPVGKFTFTYPEYENGWTVNASPDGTLSIGDKTYDYLFWEGVQSSYVVPENKGDCVASNETVAYLEKQLENYGLNYREKQDFITFWAPKLISNTYNYIVFIEGDAYDEAVASHESSYTFDSNIKLYMLYQGLDTEVESFGQVESSVKREGSVYVEWGGGEYNQLVNINQL